jgi:hypothetical protein
MFEELPYIFGFMALSIVVSYLLRKYSSGLLLKAVNVLTMFGIVIHEVCHFIMCFITHSPVEKVSLLKKIQSTEQKNSGDFGYYGQVKLMEHKVSFLQAFLVSFAPLYLSFWLFFLILGLLFTVPMHPLLIVLSVCLLISLVLASSPSFQDLKIIPRAFAYDVGRSLYQILLVIVSLFATVLLVVSFDILFLHEIFVYLIIAGFYCVFKFGIRLVRNGYLSIYLKRTNRIDKSFIQIKRNLHKRSNSWKMLRLKNKETVLSHDFGTQE